MVKREGQFSHKLKAKIRRRSFPKMIAANEEKREYKTIDYSNCAHSLYEVTS